MKFNFGSSDSPDRKIYESLEIFRRLADSNKQIASAVSEIVTNHFISTKCSQRPNFPTNLTERIPARNSSPAQNLLQPSYTSSLFTPFTTGAYAPKAPPPTKQQPSTKNKQEPGRETVFSLLSKPLPAEAFSLNSKNPSPSSPHCLEVAARANPVNQGKQQRQSRRKLFHQPCTLDCSDDNASANYEIATQPEQHRKSEVSISSPTLPQSARCKLDCRHTKYPAHLELATQQEHRHTCKSSNQSASTDHQETLTDQTDPDLPGLESFTSTAESAGVCSEQPRGKFWHSQSESSSATLPSRTQSTLPGYWTTISVTYDTPSQQYELLSAADDQLTCQKAGETKEAE